MKDFLDFITHTTEGRIAFAEFLMASVQCVIAFYFVFELLSS